MPFITVVAFTAIDSNDLQDAQSIICKYIEFIKIAEGCTGIYHGHESGAEDSRLSITVWDSYESYTKLQSSEELPILVESMKNLGMGNFSSLQNVHFESDVIGILGAPVVELATIKAKDDSASEEVLTIVSKIQEFSAHGDQVGGLPIVGKIESDGGVMLLVPWNNIEGAKKGAESRRSGINVDMALDVCSAYAILRRV